MRFVRCFLACFIFGSFCLAQNFTAVIGESISLERSMKLDTLVRSPVGGSGYAAQFKSLSDDLSGVLLLELKETHAQDLATQVELEANLYLEGIVEPFFDTFILRGVGHIQLQTPSLATGTALHYTLPATFLLSSSATALKADESCHSDNPPEVYCTLGVVQFDAALEVDGSKDFAGLGTFVSERDNGQRFIGLAHAYLDKSELSQAETINPFSTVAFNDLYSIESFFSDDPHLPFIWASAGLYRIPEESFYFNITTLYLQSN